LAGRGIEGGEVRRFERQGSLDFGLWEHNGESLIKAVKPIHKIQGSGARAILS
jgi:hypothetical protein